MISYTYLSLFVICFAYSAAVEQVQEGSTTPPASEDVAHRELTDAGYVIRHGSALYKYPLRIVPPVRRIQPVRRKPTEETNEIKNEELVARWPLIYFTTYETPDNPSQQGLPDSKPYIEIRKKRDVENVDAEIPESSKVGKLRRKRTYCGKCGGGGGGYYVPVTYAVYPVHSGFGGGGKGCNTCGGYGGGGRGGGGGGSYSYSSSSAQSSSGGFGWGKK